MPLLHVNFFSNVLGMASQMDVILPQTAYSHGAKPDGAKYQTLYLLHGMSDDHTIWQRRTSIERYATDYNIAVIMPNGHLSWYTDMFTGQKYYTFFTKELPYIVRSLFPQLSDKREDNFVAGLSMGGYGAFKLALGEPETFCAAASLSGALDISAFSHTDSRRPYFETVFGPAEKIKGGKDDLLNVADCLADSGRPLPKLYMWCGTEDYLYQQNLDMKALLIKRGYDITYEESPGDHQWKYWDDKIKNVLTWLPIRK